MKNPSEYYSKTKIAYQTVERATLYQARQTKGISWERFTTWKERLCITKSLRYCSLTETDKVLDIPCGTGILGTVLDKFPPLIVASDISREMMGFARREYNETRFKGLVQADITTPPFKKGIFICVVTIGLMHRLPDAIRKKALKEIALLSNRFIIVTYSIDSPIQRIKRKLLRKIQPSYLSAPSAIPFQHIIEEISSNGLILRKKFTVMPFLSSELVLLLEKNIINEVNY